MAKALRTAWSTKPATQSKDGQIKIDIPLKETYTWPKAHEMMLSITNYERNANPNYSVVSPHASQNGHHQKVYKQ